MFSDDQENVEGLEGVPGDPQSHQGLLEALVGKELCSDSLGRAVSHFLAPGLV